MPSRKVWIGSEWIEIGGSGGGDVFPIDPEYPGQANVLEGDELIWDGSLWVFSRASVTEFLYTGAAQEFIVPAGVTSLHVIMAGGSGGDGSPGVIPFGAGGSSRIYEFDLTVTPEESLGIYVGGAGGPGSTGAQGAGGWNGGADGTGLNSGGGGGGASDIRSGGSALTDRIAVAGGAGGGGGAATSSAQGFAGGGGDTASDGIPGQNRDISGTGDVGWSGLAGTDVAGGTGGLRGSIGLGGTINNGADGVLGIGGTGGQRTQTGCGGGGGAGGGVYGGGGGGGGSTRGNGGSSNRGGGGAGGGGSDIPNLVADLGLHEGNGFITISYVP